MTTNFVPQEIAKQLRELGFDEPCLAYYDKDGDLLGDIGINEDIDNLYRNSYFVIYKDFSESEYTAPLYQQVFRWFREKYNISYSIDWMSRSSEFYNGYYVHFRGINDNKINQENFIVLNDELPSKGYKVYKTYEEAELACLNKLIEIVKTK
jgi:hypothetical protein